MSVYKRAEGETYSYDFRLRGHRFSGNCGTANRREALAYERDVARPAALKQITAQEVAKRALRGEAPLTLNLASARYWEEKAQHLKNADEALRQLGIAIDHFGPEARLDDIRDPDIAAYVAALRGRHVRDNPEAQRLSPTTVNRIGVDRLSALFGHARRKWKLNFPHEPDWKAHTLDEPKPMPKEFGAATRRDMLDDLAEGYRDVIAFAFATGLRKAELLITWDQVDWELGIIHVTQKGTRLRRVVMSREVRAILGRCKGIHPTHVFTYVCRHRGGTGGGKLKLGQRYPVTYSGLRSAFDHMRARLEITGTIHTARHTRAMTILRETGNLKAAQQQLGHARIETTATYYAHVMDDDLRGLLDRTDAATNATKIATKKRASPSKR